MDLSSKIRTEKPMYDIDVSIATSETLANLMNK